LPQTLISKGLRAKNRRRRFRKSFGSKGLHHSPCGKVFPCSSTDDHTASVSHWSYSSSSSI